MIKSIGRAIHRGSSSAINKNQGAGLVAVIETGGSLDSFRELSLLNLNASVNSSLLNSEGSQCEWNEKIAEVVNQASGASGAIQTTTANQPYALPIVTPVLYLPGVSGNSASVPNSENLDGFSEFTLIFENVRSTDWTSSQREYFMAKYSGGSNGFYFRKQGANINSVVWWGGTLKVSSWAHGLTGNQAVDIKFIRRGTFIECFIDSGSGFESLGTDAISSGTIGQSSSDLHIGAISNTISDVIKGHIGRVRFWNDDDVDPVLVLDADFGAGNVDHLAKTGTATTGQTITINQSGGNEAMVLKHSAIRSDENSLLRSAFDEAQQGGRYVIVFSILGNGGATSPRVLSVNKTGAADSDPSGWLAFGSSSDLLSFAAGAIQTTDRGAFAGNIIFEGLATSEEYKTVVNNGTPKTANVDISTMEVNHLVIFNNEAGSRSLLAVIHEVLWFEDGTVSDAQMAEGISLLAAEYDFQIA